MSEQETICQVIYLFASNYFYNVTKDHNNVLIRNSRDELITSVHVPNENVYEIKVRGSEYYGAHEVYTAMVTVVDFIKMVYNVHSYPQTVFNALINLNG